MKQILDTKIVPVVVIDRAEDAVPVAKALSDGGINIIEITFRTPAAEQAIRNISTEMPEMLVGAGTVLTGEQVDAAANAGARFGVAPGLNEKTVAHAAKKGFAFFPGVATASEIEKAMSLGCKLLKFFPAEPLGGARLLKSLSAPYAHTHVKFIPLGGISVSNAADYLLLPSVAAIGGSWIADRKSIAGGKWGEIAARAQEAVGLGGRGQ